MKRKEIEKRIEESKQHMDVYRKISQQRNFNPDVNLPNTLDFNSNHCKKTYFDDLALNK